MDITLPELNRSHDKPRLEMWCPEKRRPREIAWAGFGFQVWCQMLTHIVRWRHCSIFLIDEPDIYLHSDLQRQLLGILRSLGPDIMLATHSTEMVTEAETEDIILVDKNKNKSRRLRKPDQLSEVFDLLGSNMNPVLTQIAKTRRVVFVEGNDFHIIARFARRLGFDRLANRSDFAVVEVKGFNPEKIRNLKEGMEKTLGVQISAAAILDSDYRSRSECVQIEGDLRKYCNEAVVHECKEIENFLLVAKAIDRVANARLKARAYREGHKPRSFAGSEDALEEIYALQKTYVCGQRLASAKRFDRDSNRGTHEEIINTQELDKFEAEWSDPIRRAHMVGGKDVFSKLCKLIQDDLRISITAGSVIDAMHLDEVPAEMNKLIRMLDGFANGAVPENAAS